MKKSLPSFTKKTSVFVSLLVLFLGVLVVFAIDTLQQWYKISSNLTGVIHTELTGAKCLSIYNMNDHWLFVPTKSNEEIELFIGNHPEYADITLCYDAICGVVWTWIMGISYTGNGGCSVGSFVTWSYIYQSNESAGWDCNWVNWWNAQSCTRQLSWCIKDTKDPINIIDPCMNNTECYGYMPSSILTGEGCFPTQLWFETAPDEMTWMCATLFSWQQACDETSEFYCYWTWTETYIPGTAGYCKSK